jgi:hypothetical protein
MNPRSLGLAFLGACLAWGAFGQSIKLPPCSAVVSEGPPYEQGMCFDPDGSVRGWTRTADSTVEWIFFIDYHATADGYVVLPGIQTEDRKP